MERIKKYLTFHSAARVLLVAFANVLLAASVKFFLVPPGLATGGGTGLALALSHAFGFDLSVTIFVINMAMLIFGAATLGARFAMSTVISSFVYPIALKILDSAFPNVVITNDILLCALYYGAGVGLAVGIAFRAGSSTGGLDVPCLVLDKYLKIPAAATMYITDVLVLFLQVFFTPTDKVLYSILLVAVYSIIIDKMMLIGTTQTEVKIVSAKAEEIRDAILTEIDRGVTLLEAKGGYSMKDTEVILSVLSNREVPKLERIVHRIDPECFMTVSRINEVKGRGFSMRKDYVK